MGKIQILSKKNIFVGKKLPEITPYTRTGFTGKWRWKNSSFQYVVQNDMLNNFYFRTDLGFITVRAPEFLEVWRPIIAKCHFDRNFQKIISSYISNGISWLFFYLVDLVKENTEKIKIKLKKIHFDG